MKEKKLKVLFISGGFLIVAIIMLMLSLFPNKKMNKSNDVLADVSCMITSGPTIVYGEDGAYSYIANCKNYNKTGDCYERAGTTDPGNCGPDDGLDCYIYRKYHVECSGSTTTTTSNTCPQGKHLKSDGTCTPCEPNSYGGGGTSTSCTKCPSPYNDGTTAGETTISSCQAYVGAGYGLQFVGNGGQKYACSVGYYSQGGTVKYGSTLGCTPCPAGSTTKSQGATSVASCNICISGYHKDTNGNCVKDGTTPKTASINCLNPLAGTDAPIASCTGCTFLSNSAVNNAKNATAGSYYFTAKLNSGYDAFENGSNSKNCSVLKNSNLPKQNSADSCYKNSQYYDATTDKCVSCPLKYPYLKKASTDSSQCYRIIKAGEEIQVRGGDPIACLKGYYSVQREAYYNELSECTKCQTGYTTKSTGATSKDECVKVTSSQTSTTNLEANCFAYDQYYDKNQNKCASCPKGFALKNPASSISACTVTLYGTEIVTAYANPTLCPKGTYQEKREVNYGSAARCVSCQAGTTTQRKGATSKDECVSGGTTSTSNTCLKGEHLKSDGTCTPCEPNSYGGGGTSTSCTKCPSPYNDGRTVGATTILSCEADVSAGLGLQFTGYTAELHSCTIGFYSQGGTVKYGSSLGCSPCPTGSTTSKPGATSIASCNKCITGYTKDANGNCVKSTTPSNNVIACLQGQYATAKGCVDCGNGEWSDGGQVAICSACPAGYACKNRTKTACTGNKYSPGGRSECLICDGTVKVSGGVNVACDSNKSSFLPDQLATAECTDDGNIVCHNCSVVQARYDSASYSNILTVQANNNYAFADGKTLIEKSCQVRICQEGWYVTLNGCEPCNDGKWSSGGRTTTCTPCPAGYACKNNTKIACTGNYFSREGSTNCDSCPSNYSKPNNNITDKFQCERIVYAGYEIYLPFSSPKMCAKGTYSEDRVIKYGGYSRCNSCDPGYTTNSMGAKSEAECIQTSSPATSVTSPATPPIDQIKCDPGAGWNSQTNQCEPCQGNTIQKYTAHRSCWNCPAGTEANQTHTKCDLKSCSLGYYIDNGHCSKCSKGHYCDGIVQKECEDGKYQDKEGMSSCELCPSGTVSNSDHTACSSKSKGSSSSTSGGNGGKSNVSLLEKCYKDTNKHYIVGNFDNQAGYTLVSSTINNCNNINIKKSDMSGNTISGSTIEFINALNPNDIKTYNIGEFDFSMLMPGNYIIREKTAPTGYKLDSNDIKIIIDNNGVINVTSNAKIDMNATNNTRNVEIKLIDEDAAALADSAEKCYVKKGIEDNNEYCYGDTTTCIGYTDTIDGRTDETCVEEDACYKKQDGTYIMGKYSENSNYQYIGVSCPACYEDAKGEYHWTNTPASSEKIILNITSSDKCVTPSKSNSKLLYIIIALIILIIILVILKLRKGNTNQDYNMTTEY